jgi:hypothetical protein
MILGRNVGLGIGSVFGRLQSTEGDLKAPKLSRATCFCVFPSMYSEFNNELDEFETNIGSHITSWSWTQISCEQRLQVCPFHDH